MYTHTRWRCVYIKCFQQKSMLSNWEGGGGLVCEPLAVRRDRSFGVGVNAQRPVVFRLSSCSLNDLKC